MRTLTREHPVSSQSLSIQQTGQPINRMFFTRLLIQAGFALCLCMQAIAAVDDADSNTGNDADATENPAEGNQPAGEQKPVFDVWEFRVTGNTLLDDTLVERSVYPYLGRGKTIDDIEAAQVALQTLFKDNGYPTVLVNIPQQDVSDGIVQLDIVQGRVGRLKVSGSRYFSLGRIRSTVPALAENEVPHLPSVQQQLQELNASNSNLRVTPIFRPGSRPGTVTVDLRVRDEFPLHASLEVNGRNSEGTTRTRLIGEVGYDNLWLKSHSLSLVYQTSPEDFDEVSVLVGTYVLPVGGSGERLAIYALSSDSETGVASGGALSVIGSGSIIGTRWVNPLKGGERFFHSLVAGVDYKNFDEAIDLVGGGSVVTPIDYTLFSIEYNATSLGDSGKTSLTAGVFFAPRAFGNEEFEFEIKRFQARPNFSYVNANLEHVYRLDNGVRLRGILGGQIAGQPLVSNEQYGIGGAESVRGYHESQLLGDDAIRATIEMQTPDFDMLERYRDMNFHAKAFLDGGVTRTNDPLPDVDARRSISGAGIGLYMTARKTSASPSMPPTRSRIPVP